MNPLEDPLLGVKSILDKTYLPIIQALRGPDHIATLKHFLSELINYGYCAISVQQYNFRFMVTYAPYGTDGIFSAFSGPEYAGSIACTGDITIHLTSKQLLSLLCEIWG